VLLLSAYTFALSDRHLQVLLIYALFVILAILLLLVPRWAKPTSEIASTWGKLPLYLLLNLIFLIAIWLPTTWHILTLLLVVIGGAACWELNRALGLRQRECVVLVGVTVGLIVIADFWASMGFMQIWLATLLGVLALISLVSSGDWLGRRVLSLAGGVVYLPICLAALLWLWHKDEGGFHTVFLYMVIAANDAFAQIIGKQIGRHSLAPSINPGKTIEGAIGGLVFAVALGTGLSQAVGWSYMHGAMISFALGLAGIIGDLTESSWKRALGLKDFSTLLGSQGGVLDRFDALIFAAPVYVLLSGL
jgi:phosphatidate cytidylyltransferase